MSNETKKFLIGGVATLILLFGFLYFHFADLARHQFKVVFMNVGQGDAALIQFESGEKMLVDCGPNKMILSALGRNTAFYDRTIDYVLVTHPDLDHYGGCIDVLKNYRVRVVIINGQEKNNDQYFNEWNRLAHEHQIKIISGHELVQIASSTLEFFSPDSSLTLEKKEADSNNYSIVFRLTHDQEHFLFTGDMEEPLEKALILKYCQPASGAVIDCPLQAEVLKVGHHGSDGSSSEFFLSFVKPVTAVISVGKNKFGHPTLRAIRHLERTGAKILRTDQLGDVVLR